MFLILTSFGSDPFLKSVLAQVATSQKQNINATNLFETGQMILSNNVKRLVIPIPDEGHHGPGEEDESRFIAQPFVPQNVVVRPGTQVVWYNGDVGHEHNIVVMTIMVIKFFKQMNLPNLLLQDLLHLTILETFSMQIL
ncbi:MAG TPA: hypothetical protein VFR94_13810 [Nitrososphaeraceae archaeon]|nr:hypothetical protein [Nitrososphaeraceae archaeon]